jgi:membrane-bound ClpP family serine protease
MSVLPTPPSALRPYLLAQVPGWLMALLLAGLLHRWFGVSPLLAAGLVVLWVVKDLALYPLLKRFYVSDTAHPMLGQVGRTVTPLAPGGFVRVRGELWQARANGTPVGAEASVRVHAVDGLVLHVEELSRPPRRG